MTTTRMVLKVDIIKLKLRKLKLNIIVKLDLWDGWVDILTTLSLDGANGVTLKQLKPYISKLFFILF